MAPFYERGSTTSRLEPHERGSTASRLEPLRGVSFLITTNFPEIPGTRFIDLGRMKG